MGAWIAGKRPFRTAHLKINRIFAASRNCDLLGWLLKLHRFGPIATAKVEGSLVIPIVAHQHPAEAVVGHLFGAHVDGELGERPYLNRARNGRLLLRIVARNHHQPVAVLPGASAAVFGRMDGHRQRTLRPRLKLNGVVGQCDPAGRNAFDLEQKMVGGAALVEQFHLNFGRLAGREFRVGGMNHHAEPTGAALHQRAARRAANRRDGGSLIAWRRRGHQGRRGCGGCAAFQLHEKRADAQRLAGVPRFGDFRLQLHFV